MTTGNLGPLHFRDTASKSGRVVAVSPDNSKLAHLNYARIRLDSALEDSALEKKAELRFETEKRETGLICLEGECQLRLRGETVSLGQYDGIYIPRDSSVEITTPTRVDLIEVSAEVEGEYPLQVVRYAEIKNDPTLCFRAGAENTTRDLTIVLGKNVKAGRIVAGFTRSAPGHWTSWPPHEHHAMLEEVYVYFDMPAPAFGVQLVYTQADDPECVAIVRDGDAVLMPAGYHPNVAVPNHSINFVWLMAAQRELLDRQFGVVNVQPGFDGKGSGLEASRK